MIQSLVGLDDGGRVAGKIHLEVTSFTGMTNGLKARRAEMAESKCEQAGRTTNAGQDRMAGVHAAGRSEAFWQAVPAVAGGGFLHWVWNILRRIYCSQAFKR